jgi:nicotinate phosphoribosyltransferase
MMMVSRGKNLIDFGLRRAHGAQEGAYAARSSYITGFFATSNVEAGRIYDIPISGTMAHSYVLIHKSEEEAFRAYIQTFPKDVVLLIDTYDTRKGAETAARLALEGLPITGVRIDSGIISEIVPQVRKILDSHGLQSIRIIVSGGVDEHDIARWLDADIPIDAFGVGTRLLTSADIPYLDMTYKLVEYDEIPRSKTSTGKQTIPGRRNISRFYDKQGIMTHDVILKDGSYTEGEDLLELVMKDGRRIVPSPSLAKCRENFSQDYARLPMALKSLEKKDYPVIIEDY